MYFSLLRGSACPLLNARDFPPCRPFPLLSRVPLRTLQVCSTTFSSRSCWQRTPSCSVSTMVADDHQVLLPVGGPLTTVVGVGPPSGTTREPAQRPANCPARDPYPFYCTACSFLPSLVMLQQVFRQVGRRFDHSKTSSWCSLVQWCVLACWDRVVEGPRVRGALCTRPSTICT